MSDVTDPIESARNSILYLSVQVSDRQADIDALCGRFSRLFSRYFLFADGIMRDDDVDNREVNRATFKGGAHLVDDLTGIQASLDDLFAECFQAKDALDAALMHLQESNAEVIDTQAERIRRLQEREAILQQYQNSKTERLRKHSVSDPEVRAKVWSITGGRCFYCSVELSRERSAEAPNRSFHVDHLVAKANGGPDHISNYVPACHSCNSSKHARPFAEFFRWRGDTELKVVGGTDA
jgi:5-methylcytosine-specific restriction endonuclease McrA